MTMTRRKALTLALAAPAAAFTATRAAAQGTVHDVTIQNFAFTPAVLQISAGDTVRFTNADGTRHSAVDLGGAWDTGLLSQGQSATLTFNGRGAFNYRCGPHSQMRGQIIIN